MIAKLPVQLTSSATVTVLKFKFNSGFQLPLAVKLEALRLLKLCTNITAITMSRGITKLPHPTLHDNFDKGRLQDFFPESAALLSGSCGAAETSRCTCPGLGPMDR